MQIRIYKSKFKKYWDMDWEDVPEFIVFGIDNNFIRVIKDKFTNPYK